MISFGLEVPTHFDGRTLAPVLADPSLAHRDAVVSCETPFRAIRTLTKKYIHYLDEVYETDELFDLADDPDETRNLIEADPNEAARLHRRLVEILGEELAERPHPT